MEELVKTVCIGSIMVLQLNIQEMIENAQIIIIHCVRFQYNVCDVVCYVVCGGLNDGVSGMVVKVVRLGD